MKKVHLAIVSIIYIMILILGLSGCVGIKDKSVSTESNYSTTKVKSATTESNYSAVSKTNETMKGIDYNQYLKKIWVIKSWDGGAYEYSSFFISKITNNAIEGRLSTGLLALPDFHLYSFNSSRYLGDFSGTIKDNSAECQFSDAVGNKGKVTFVFNGNDEIAATLMYTNNPSLNGKFLFRPYNLSDIKDFAPLKEHSFSVDLNSWGTVNFVSGEVNHIDKVFPDAYLTNEHNDILYEFQVPFQTGTKIIAASVKDLNKDGLKDIHITTKFIEDPSIENIEWTFYQMSNGLFYAEGVKK